MRRRQFIAGLVGAAAAYPLRVRAREDDGIRRIEVLLPAAAHDPEFQQWVDAFAQALRQLGWVAGRNVKIETHWATASANEIRKHAAELAALAPDVILAYGASTVGPLLQ